MIRAANLALKFALELAAVAAFAYWGATVGGGGVAGVVIGIAAATAAIVLWGRFAAPRSRHRLRGSWRVPFELTVFALAALALLDRDQVAPAVILAALVLGNSALLELFDQWER